MRRNPRAEQRAARLPRRATDRVEDAVAWFLTAVGFLVVIAAVVAGASMYTQQTDTAGKQVGHAVLLEDAKVIGVGDPGTVLPAPVKAMWTDRDGAQRTGVIFVKPTATAGSRVDVRIDAGGRATAASSGHVYAVVGGIVIGLLVVLCGGALIGLAWGGVRRVTGAQNARRWGREWERVGPTWTGRPL